MDYSKTNPNCRIVCGAMCKGERIIAGARHYDKIIREQMESSEGLDWWRGCEQGFIDQFGNFYNREEAWIVAEKNNQIIVDKVSIHGMVRSSAKIAGNY